SLYKRPEDRENFLKQLKQKKKIEYNEMELRRRDGKPIHVICNVSGIFDDHGELMQIQGYLFDDTERKEMEKHFQQVQKMEAIGTLAGGIAHDFNNILAAIIGYAEITKDDLTPGSMPHRNLQSIYQAGIRAKELVQQILTFSRQTQHELKPIKMDLILREALKFLNASLPPSIRLRKTIEPDCRTILADPSQIHQLIMNLCTNAYQAIDEGGEGIIEVSLEPENLEAERQVNHYKLSPGEYVKFTVKDSGCGMDEATRKRIFDPFFTTKAVGKGTGLGLSVVHGIVEKLHGIIFVTSQPGQGSTFTVYLPGYDQSAPAEEQIDEAIPGGTEHILLVDDEQTFVAMEKQLLERLGYTVTTATHGFEALELFRITPNRFDLVMTDQLMPNMTGLELAEELLQIRPHLPIILMSGFSENISREQAQNMGLFDSISKPIVKRDMVVAVRNALDSVHQKEV
ncbi:MAG: response regulator, partial [Aliifodinibius sp.]|nr:response regulator [Fodinibius sp.]